MPKKDYTVLDGHSYSDEEIRTADTVTVYTCDICGAVIPHDQVAILQVTPIMIGSFVSMGRAAVNAYVHAACLRDKASWLLAMFVAIYGVNAQKQIDAIIAEAEEML